MLLLLFIFTNALCAATKAVDDAVNDAEKHGSLIKSIHAGSQGGGSSTRTTLLLTVLTANNLPLLRLSVESVRDQAPHNLEVHTVIVVNSKKEDYFQKVRDEYGSKYEVVETTSNGRPGMGHNSCLELFRSRNEDYFYMLDGDDFFYHTALMTLEQIIKEHPFDVVLLVPGDSLVSVTLHPSVVHARVGERMLIRHESTYKLVLQTDDKTDWPTPFNQVNTNVYDLWEVGGFQDSKFGVRFRTPIWSRKGIQAAPLPLYDTDMFIHDDVVPQFWALSQRQNKSSDLAVRIIWSTHLLLYNAVNPFSVSTRVDQEVFDSDNGVLFGRYGQYRDILFSNGAFDVAPEIVNDSLIKTSYLMSHREDFLAKYSKLFQDYFLLGGVAGTRDRP